jgi:hypothetical protein
MKVICQGIARLETPGSIHITPAAIRYAAVRGEELLGEDSGLERQLRDCSSNLITFPSLRAPGKIPHWIKRRRKNEDPISSIRQV